MELCDQFGQNERIDHIKLKKIEEMIMKRQKEKLKKNYFLII